MSSKSYEKDCARLVQEAAPTSYSTALRWVRDHIEKHPEKMPASQRAFAVVLLYAKKKE